MLATLTKHATEYTTTYMGAWICLPPEAVRCQRRETTLTTPLANPVGRAVPLRFEPVFAMIDALYATCEPYCSYRLLHQRLLYVREVVRYYEGCAGGWRSSRGRALLKPKVGPDCLYVDSRCARYGRQPLGAGSKKKKGRFVASEVGGSDRQTGLDFPL